MLADAKMLNLLSMDISDIADKIRNFMALLKSTQSEGAVLPETVSEESSEEIAAETERLLLRCCGSDDSLYEKCYKFFDISRTDIKVLRKFLSDMRPVFLNVEEDSVDFDDGYDVWRLRFRDEKAVLLRRYYSVHPDGSYSCFDSFDYECSGTVDETLQYICDLEFTEESKAVPKKQEKSARETPKIDPFPVAEIIETPIIAEPLTKAERQMIARKRVMSDASIHYIFDKKTKLLHEKSCCNISKIEDAHFVVSYFIGSEALCPQCCSATLLRKAGCDDVEKAVKIFTELGASHKKIKKLVQTNNAQISFNKNEPDIISIKVREDRWRIEKHPNAKVTLWHNNYIVKEDLSRRFEIGYHIQKNDITCCQAIAIICDYDWSKHPMPMKIQAARSAMSKEYDIKYHWRVFRSATTGLLKCLCKCARKQLVKSNNAD